MDFYQLHFSSPCAWVPALTHSWVLMLYPEWLVSAYYQRSETVIIPGLLATRSALWPIQSTGWWTRGTSLPVPHWLFLADPPHHAHFIHWVCSPSCSLVGIASSLSPNPAPTTHLQTALDPALFAGWVPWTRRGTVYPKGLELTCREFCMTLLSLKPASSFEHCWPGSKDKIQSWGRSANWDWDFKNLRRIQYLWAMGWQGPPSPSLLSLLPLLLASD